MTRPVIAVDIDDVLYPTAQHVADIVGRPFGLKLDAYRGEQRLRDSVAAATGMTPEAAADLARQAFLHERFADMEPFAEALSAVRELAEQYRIVAVTARSNESHATTRRVVERDFGSLIDETYFPNVDGWSDKQIDKLPHLLEVGARWMIDDKLSHLEPLTGTTIRGGLFGDYPWNRHDTLPAQTVRLANWEAVLEALRCHD